MRGCGPPAWPAWRNCARRRARLGVRLIACEAGLRAEGLDAARLLPGVEVAGIATFLAAVGAGQIVSI